VPGAPARCPAPGLTLDLSLFLLVLPPFFRRSVPTFSLTPPPAHSPFANRLGISFNRPSMDLERSRSLRDTKDRSLDVRSVLPLRYPPRERNQLRFMNSANASRCLAFCHRPICSETSKTTSPHCHLVARVRLLSPSILLLLAHGDREGSDFALSSILRKGEANSDGFGFLACNLMRRYLMQRP